MNIYSKLDQFIKSARFILEHRNFQKQAAPPNLSGVYYNPNQGLQNAAAFQRSVNLNPLVYRQPRRPLQPYRPSKYEQQREAAGLNSQGYKTWCTLMDRAKTVDDLKQMQQQAPQLIGHMPDYQDRLNYGMNRAIRRINTANGTAYSWNGKKLNLKPTPTSTATPTGGVKSTGIPKYKPTITWNKSTGYDLGQPVTQSAFDTAKTEYNNLNTYWNGLTEQQRQNPKMQAGYNRRLQQLREFGKAYNTYVRNMTPSSYDF